jgi:hypothetical protein
MCSSKKGSVLTADKTVAIARSVRRKAGSVKINLADGRWQMEVGGKAEG